MAQAKKKKGSRRKKKRASKKSQQLRQQRNTVWLNVLPNDLWLEVKKGTFLLDALLQDDIEIENECGGNGQCGKCKVRILTAIDSPTDAQSLEFLSLDEIDQGIRLACRVILRKDLAVYIGQSDPEFAYFQILKTGYTPLLCLDPLVKKKLVQYKAAALTPGVSDFQRLQNGLGEDYHKLRSTLHGLQNLPEVMKVKEGCATAVLHDNLLLDCQPEDCVTNHYGLVFDIGTSTLVAKLIDLADGRQVAAVSCLNRQNKYGADVISRLKYIKEDPEGLSKLHVLLINDLSRLTDRLVEVAGIEPADMFVAAAAGNTTMQHLLLKLNPSRIAEAPFVPVTTQGIVMSTNDVGLALHPEARLYMMPCRSGYIGGDMISVILASGVLEQDEQMILGLDLGTNGEIFLGNSRRLLTCSAAAGPALEGANISHGSIAKAGSIEGVRLQDGRLHYKDIGNIKPTGICGSGLVDLVAVLANCGIISPEGLIQPPAEPGLEELAGRVLERNGVYDFQVANAEESYHGTPIFLTQKDVREFQFAKGAIASGIQILLDEMGLEIGDVGHIYLAGALGNYINPYSAMRLGLIPMVEPAKVSSLGNAASTGASMALLSRSHWGKAVHLAQTIEHVELSRRKDFSDYFIKNLDFPEINIWERRL
jgi:uncharacterized 2Fe-2S/4Fe-4S cluster protein (DUF4445 family)